MLRNLHKSCCLAQRASMLKSSVKYVCVLRLILCMRVGLLCLFVVHMNALYLCEGNDSLSFLCAIFAKNSTECSDTHVHWMVHSVAQAFHAAKKHRNIEHTDEHFNCLTKKLLHRKTFTTMNFLARNLFILNFTLLLFPLLPCKRFPLK